MRAMNNLTAFTPDVDISQAWTLPSSWYTDPILLAQEKDKNILSDLAVGWFR
jgi:hypothetical protein